MKLFGSVVSFVLADQSQAERFLQSCKLGYGATSFGGIHTTAERLARWGGDKIPDGFIRSSAGCENTEDLLNDLGQALDASHPATAEEYGHMKIVADQATHTAVVVLVVLLLTSTVAVVFTNFKDLQGFASFVFFVFISGTIGGISNNYR